MSQKKHTIDLCPEITLERQFNYSGKGVVLKSCLWTSVMTRQSVDYQIYL